ncbi:bifunctional adenosylcobinamide kinase/adenosylcobinamide-phosphate guanylyltransferase [Methylocucumis oryzae]|uniref:bifunctional adenosylcobinamide kinase/adenosylcobinamide-phosphate guanylyltransferase n=1 Tax=Methylocucumis oryzae TaxID=1632867 RepID=UPI000A91D60E|nr:bifunctional adenosylcobinamide kinase/adenosylcobinamide-phosphate guanylyltransferase [Methylocucumis oryzae]
MLKSGKSRLAEEFILTRYNGAKPYYLATTELLDVEMQQRITDHQARRQDAFDTIDAPVNLFSTISVLTRPVLIECVTMWLNNLMYYGQSDEAILDELTRVAELSHDLVFVLNEVGCGVIPDNALARRFVDLSGKAAQLLAGYCDKVFLCSAGLALPLK